MLKKSRHIQYRLYRLKKILFYFLNKNTNFQYFKQKQTNLFIIFVYFLHKFSHKTLANKKT